MGLQLIGGKQEPTPIKYHGAAFTCEPTGNLVHMEILTPKGATFTAKPHKQGVEFLATTDDWFRPVFLTHGPDGALYIVDMYRAVIEHPEFMPPELQKRPDLTAGRDKGRIWRIVPKDHKTQAIRPNLDKATIPELVKTLEHKEPWWRTTAQRLLLERNDKAMIEPLGKLLEKTASPHARILAAWTLARNEKLMLRHMPRLIQDKNPRVIDHVLRLLDNAGAADVMTTVLESGDTSKYDARTWFEMTLALGGVEDNSTATPLALIASSKYAEDPWTRLAVQTALPKHHISILKKHLAVANERPDVAISSRSAMVRGMAAMIALQKNPDSYLETLGLVSRQPLRVKWAGFVGIAEGLERRGCSLTAVTSELPESKRANYSTFTDTLFEVAGEYTTDVEADLEHRLLCVRILGQSPWPDAKRWLVPLTTSASSLELRIASVRSLASHSNGELPRALVGLWPSAGPPIRREILEAMLRRPERISFLLDEIEAKRVKASEIDASRTRQLVYHPDAKIRERSKKLLQDNLPADRLEVLKKYQAALAMKGDAKRGREVFKHNCATCHKVAGIGIDVGPDIADTRTKTLAALLNDILVPNAAIDNNYINYLVSTKDGRVLTGMLAAETATSVTLKRAEGQTDTLLRKDIEEITSTGISLMPDGLEKNITVAEMADLLRFLKDWRYLDGTVPTAP